VGPVKSVTIRQALQRVADYPVPLDDEVINMAVSDLVARSLFDIANRPDAAVRGSMTRANKARKMILDRMDGRRRPGVKPKSKSGDELEFLDLTGGEITHVGEEAAAEDLQPPAG
jgi:hypothetical protein